MVYLEILVLLGVLVVIHEAGHLGAARAVGIPVESFSVGFGPKLWSRRLGTTEYALRALPFGGFVMPAGLDGGGWRAVSLGRRLFFFAGGPLANLAARSAASRVARRARG